MVMETHHSANPAAVPSVKICHKSNLYLPPFDEHIIQKDRHHKETCSSFSVCPIPGAMVQKLRPVVPITAGTEISSLSLDISKMKM